MKDTSAVEEFLRTLEEAQSQQSDDYYTDDDWDYEDDEIYDDAYDEEYDLETEEVSEEVY